MGSQGEEQNSEDAVVGFYNSSCFFFERFEREPAARESGWKATRRGAGCLGQRGAGEEPWLAYRELRLFSTAGAAHDGLAVVGIPLIAAAV